MLITFIANQGVKTGHLKTKSDFLFYLFICFTILDTIFQNWIVIVYSILEQSMTPRSKVMMLFGKRWHSFLLYFL